MRYTICVLHGFVCYEKDNKASEKERMILLTLLAELGGGSIWVCRRIAPCRCPRRLMAGWFLAGRREPGRGIRIGSERAVRANHRLTWFSVAAWKRDMRLCLCICSSACTSQLFRVIGNYSSQVAGLLPGLQQSFLVWDGEEVGRDRGGPACLHSPKFRQTTRSE